MARMLRWMLLTGVVAAGAFVGPMGSTEARAQIFYRGSGNRYEGFYALRGGFFPGIFTWGFGPWAGWGGFYGGYFGGFYPFGWYYGNVLAYPAFTYTLYPFYSYVPSTENAPYPKVIEVRNAPRTPPPQAGSGVELEPRPIATRTVVYRANRNSVSPFDRPDAHDRRIVLRTVSSR